jgi:Zn-dependent M28 family amino/carboxypeptidase
LASEPTAFDGRSDYEAFINADMPAGGLFTGAEDAKTEQQVAVYGGLATFGSEPVAFGTITNINTLALEQMADAVAHAILTFAMSTSLVSGTAQASERAAQPAGDRLGSNFRR